MLCIELPFPASILAGHANGNARWAKIEATKKHRAWAHAATLAAGRIDLPEDGDIRVHVSFVPNNRRGDRCNYANRLKPYFDGIADALGVNDRRFLPSFEYHEPQAPGCVVMEVSALWPPR